MGEKKESIGGLWLSEEKEGKQRYMYGSINGEKIVVFKNTYKKPGEKTPDYKVFASTPREAVPEDRPRSDQDDSGVPF